MCSMLFPQGYFGFKLKVEYVECFVSGFFGVVYGLQRGISSNNRSYKHHTTGEGGTNKVNCSAAVDQVLSNNGVISRYAVSR